MSGDPPSFLFPVIKATLYAANVNLVLEIFLHLVLHILKCFKQLDVDYKTKKKLYVSHSVCILSLAFCSL